ncbi:hypothetical protein SynROS8604_02489 [Synechococcus sp. ROS8604]|nr:hypothetical protein SynROS8604_02489 [Synechococcus sp. ROS8604]
MIEIVWRSMSNDRAGQCNLNTYKARHHARWHGAEQGDNSSACVMLFGLF